MTFRPDSWRLAVNARRPTRAARRYRRLICSAAFPLIVAGYGSAAAAQTSTPHTPTTTAAKPSVNAAAVGEVVVTARRRAERIQDVPVAVTAISGTQLERAGVNQVQQLQFEAPSLSINIGNPRQTNFAIRGIGNNPATDGLASSVGLYIDGVYLDRPGMADFNLLDVDQVEVLRGPQGTLFGKNTTAGALTVTTRAPSNTFTSTASADFGNYDLTSFQGAVSGPVTDELSLGLAGYKTDRTGYLHDAVLNTNNDSLHREGLRAQLLYKPNSDLSLRLIAEYGSEDDSGGVYKLYSKGPSSSASASFIPFNTWAAREGINPVFDPSGLKDDLNENERLKQQESAITAIADYKLGDFTLSSITGYRFWTFTPFNDFDWGPSNAIDNNGVNDREKQYSEEIRLTSPIGGFFDYVVGLYAFHRDLVAVSETAYGSTYSEGLGAAGNPALNNATSIIDANPETSSYAGFAQGSLHFTKKLSLTLGFRETTERSRESIDRLPLEGSSGAAPATLAPYKGTLAVANNEPSGLIDLSYKVTPDVLAYASTAYSAKAGGFNSPAVPQSTTGIIEPATDLLVKPESALNYETGLKTTWFDRRITFDVDAYWTDIWDYQANSLQINANKTVLSLITNAGSVISRGVEAETSWRATPELVFNGSAGYNDAHYVSFLNAPAVQGSTTSTQNLSGRPVVEAPRWTASLSANYTHRVSSSIEAYSTAEIAYHSGEYGYIDDSSYSYLQGYVLGNVRVGAKLSDGRYDISLWVRNIGDTRYYNQVIPAITGSGGYFAGVADPRTFGATLRAAF